MATPRLGLVVEDKPTELSCTHTGKGVLATIEVVHCKKGGGNFTPKLVYLSRHIWHPIFCVRITPNVDFFYTKIRCVET